MQTKHDMSVLNGKVMSYTQTGILVFCLLLYPFQTRAEGAYSKCIEVFRNTIQKPQGLKQQIKKKIPRKKYKPADTSDLVPDIDFNDLLSLESFIPPTESHQNRRPHFFKTAKLDGRKVFLKTIKFNKQLKELSIIRSLQERGIPTLFIGLTRDEEGRFYMVNWFIDGAFVKVRQHIVINFDSLYPITEKTYKQLIDLRNMFIRKRVVPSDFQFLISKDGNVYLIDFEYYSIFSRFNPLFLLFAYKPYAKFERAKEIIHQKHQESLND